MLPLKRQSDGLFFNSGENKFRGQILFALILASVVSKWPFEGIVKSEPDLPKTVNKAFSAARPW